MASDIVQARTYRLHNRRVTLGRLDDGDYFLQFKRLEGRKVEKLQFGLSPEAMRALAILYSLDMTDKREL